MSINWILYCNTENKFITLYSASQPTSCPNSGAHSINSSSVVPLTKDLIFNYKQFSNSAVIQGQTGYTGYIGYQGPYSTKVVSTSSIYKEPDFLYNWENKAYFDVNANPNYYKTVFPYTSAGSIQVTSLNSDNFDYKLENTTLYSDLTLSTGTILTSSNYISTAVFSMIAPIGGVQPARGSLLFYDKTANVLKTAFYDFTTWTVDNTNTIAIPNNPDTSTGTLYGVPYYFVYYSSGSTIKYDCIFTNGYKIYLATRAGAAAFTVTELYTYTSDIFYRNSYQNVFNISNKKLVAVNLPPGSSTNYLDYLVFSDGVELKSLDYTNSASSYNIQTILSSAVSSEIRCYDFHHLSVSSSLIFYLLVCHRDQNSEYVFKLGRVNNPPTGTFTFYTLTLPSSGFTDNCSVVATSSNVYISFMDPLNYKLYYGTCSTSNFNSWTYTIIDDRICTDYTTTYLTGARISLFNQKPFILYRTRTNKYRMAYMNSSNVWVIKPVKTEIGVHLETLPYGFMYPAFITNMDHNLNAGVSTNIYLARIGENNTNIYMDNISNLTNNTNPTIRYMAFS